MNFKNNWPLFLLVVTLIVAVTMMAQPWPIIWPIEAHTRVHWETIIAGAISAFGSLIGGGFVIVIYFLTQRSLIAERKKNKALIHYGHVQQIINNYSRIAYSLEFIQFHKQEDEFKDGELKVIFKESEGAIKEYKTHSDIELIYLPKNIRHHVKNRDKDIARAEKLIKITTSDFLSLKHKDIIRNMNSLVNISKMLKSTLIDLDDFRSSLLENIDD